MAGSWLYCYSSHLRGGLYHVQGLTPTFVPFTTTVASSTSVPPLSRLPVLHSSSAPSTIPCRLKPRAVRIAALWLYPPTIRPFSTLLCSAVEVALEFLSMATGVSEVLYKQEIYKPVPHYHCRGLASSWKLAPWCSCRHDWLGEFRRSLEDPYLVGTRAEVPAKATSHF